MKNFEKTELISYIRQKINMLNYVKNECDELKQDLISKRVSIKYIEYRFIWIFYRSQVVTEVASEELINRIIDRHYQYFHTHKISALVSKLEKLIEICRLTVGPVKLSDHEYDIIFNGPDLFDNLFVIYRDRIMPRMINSIDTKGIDLRPVSDYADYI